MILISIVTLQTSQENKALVSESSKHKSTSKGMTSEVLWNKIVPFMFSWLNLPQSLSHTGASCPGSPAYNTQSPPKGLLLHLIFCNQRSTIHTSCAWSILNQSIIKPWTFEKDHCISLRAWAYRAVYQHIPIGKIKAQYN